MVFSPWIGIIIVIIALIIIGAVVAFLAYKVNREEFKETGIQPKGYYMGLGIAIGLPLGIPIGLALGNIAIGPAFGLSIGVAIGSVLEKKHEHELRPLTQDEKKVRNLTLLAFGIFALIGGVVIFSIARFLD